MNSIMLNGRSRLNRGIANLWLLLFLVVGRATAASPEIPAVSVVLLEGASLQLDDGTSPDIRLPAHWINRCDTQAVRLEFKLTPLSNGMAFAVMPQLLKEDGSELALTNDGQPTLVELAPCKQLRLTLAARLLDAGTYKGSLQVTVHRASGKPEPLANVTVQIKRVTSLPPVEFATAPALLMQVARFPWENNVPLVPQVELRVYALGDTVNLAAPHLASAARKNTVDATGEGEATSFALDEEQTPKAPIAVAPGGFASAPLVFTGVPGAGRYDAKVRFSSPGYKSAEASVVVLARESMWVAVFFVFVGALLSWLMQLWGGVFKPWREFKLRLVALTLAVDEVGVPKVSPPDELDQLLDQISTNLITAFGKKASSLPWRQMSRLEGFEALLPPLRLWAACWRELPAIQPDSVRGKYWAELLALRGALISPTPDATQLGNATTTLLAMPTEIRKSIGEELDKAVTALEHDLGSNPGVALQPVRALLRSVRARLNGRQLEAALGLHQQALRAYAKAMADELRRRADSSRPEPQGVTADEWQTLCKDTIWQLDVFERQEDPESAQALLQDATAAYAQGIAQALQRAVAARPSAIRQPVVDAAIEVNKAVADRSLAATWEALEKVSAAYEKAQVAAMQPMGLADADVLSGLTRALAAPQGLGAAIQLPAWWADAARPQEAQRMARENLWMDIGVSLVVLAVSAFATVQTLWTNNPVWGGWGACLAAVLAGFAADRFAHSAVSAFQKG